MRSTLFLNFQFVFYTEYYIKLDFKPSSCREVSRLTKFKTVVVFSSVNVSPAPKESRYAEEKPFLTLILVKNDFHVWWVGLMSLRCLPLPVMPDSWSHLNTGDVNRPLASVVGSIKVDFPALDKLCDLF